MGEDRYRRPPDYPSSTLLLSLLGNHFQGRRMVVAARTFVDVLGRVGISERALRSTLSRAVDRGFLHRHRRGRQAFFELTDSTRDLLAEGAQRIFHGDPVRTDWDGAWTLLTFSIPESRRTDRHRLRVRLSWAGFAPLRDGLWLAPGRVDVVDVIRGLAVVDDVTAFVGQAVAPTCVEDVIADAWDLEEIARGYHAFLRRWDRDDPLPDAPDDLARSLWLVTEWRLLLGDDPRLPLEHLPGDWPAVRAKKVFDRLRARYLRTGFPLFERSLETLVDVD